MFDFGFVGALFGVNIEKLAATVEPINEGQKWKEIRGQAESIFKEITKGSELIDQQGCRQYFGRVGKAYFEQDLTEFFSERLFERFDWEGVGQLTHVECWRSLRKAILERYNAYKPNLQVETKTLEAAGYKKIKMLASGAQGSAWLAKNKSGQERALKVYEKASANSGGIKELIDEYRTMSEVLNDVTSVMCTYDIFQDSKCLYLVNELCRGGDFTALRKNCASQWVKLDASYWRVIFNQCMRGLNALHKHGIIHCDIKEPNIMLKTANYHRPEVCIIDFGMAQATASQGLAGGTPGYRPPETNVDNVWYPQGDVFSLGVVFFQLLADKIPSDKVRPPKLGIFQEGARNVEDVIEITRRRPPPYELIEKSCPWAMEFLPVMLAVERRERWRPAQIMNLDFFKRAPARPPGKGFAFCAMCRGLAPRS